MTKINQLSRLFLKLEFGLELKCAYGSELEFDKLEFQKQFT